MNTNHDNLKDPLEELPSELFGLSLAFLPPKFIASSSATSRGWRSFVNSNPLLHRKMDLLKLGEGKMVSILYHSNRISALSFDRLVEISLDLTSFWQEHLTTKEPLASNLESNISNLGVLMLTLSKSKASLKEIFISITADSKDCETDPLPFVGVLIENFQSFDSIRVMEVQAPTGLDLDTSRAPGHKRFLLYNDLGINELASRELEHGGELLKQVKNFVKGEIVWFHVREDLDDDHDWGPLSSTGSLKIMQELESSKSALQYLDLCNLNREDDPLSLWSFALSCQNLVSLRISLTQPLLPPLLLEVPQTTLKAANLEDISLTTDGFDIEWNSSLLNWIGDGLQDIHLDIGLIEVDEGDLVSSDVPDLIFLGSMDALRRISVKNISVRAESAGYWIEMPNLSYLDLTFLDHFAWDFFARIKSPNLRELLLRVEDYDMSLFTDSIAGLNCLIDLLQNHSSTLVLLTIGLGKVTWEDLTSYSEHTFDFKSLHQIGFFSYSRQGKDGDIFNEWLSKSRFPALVNIDCTEDSETLFKKNAPLLRPRSQWIFE